METQEIVACGAYAGVYQALDGALASGGRNLAPGADGAIQAALHQLRCAGRDHEALARLEQISLGLCRLQQSLRDGRAADCAAERAWLAELLKQWLETTPMH